MASKSMENISKNAWAIPERSGDVLGGSRAPIIDFSMVLGGLGGEASGALWRGVPVRTSINLKSNQTPLALALALAAWCLASHQNTGLGCLVSGL